MQDTHTPPRMNCQPPRPISPLSFEQFPSPHCRKHLLEKSVICLLLRYKFRELSKVEIREPQLIGGQSAWLDAVITAPVLPYSKTVPEFIKRFSSFAVGISNQSSPVCFLSCIFRTIWICAGSSSGNACHFSQFMSHDEMVFGV